MNNKSGSERVKKCTHPRLRCSKWDSYIYCDTCRHRWTGKRVLSGTVYCSPRSFNRCNKDFDRKA